MHIGNSLVSLAVFGGDLGVSLGAFLGAFTERSHRIRAAKRATLGRLPLCFVWSCLVEEEAKHAKGDRKGYELEQLGGIRE